MMASSLGARLASHRLDVTLTEFRALVSREGQPPKLLFLARAGYLVAYRSYGRNVAEIARTRDTGAPELARELAAESVDV